jgi:hypothetical protein
MLRDDSVPSLIERYLTIEDRRERRAEAERIFAVMDRVGHAMTTVKRSLEEIGFSSAPLEPPPRWKIIEAGRFLGQNLRDMAEEENSAADISDADIAFAAVKDTRMMARDHPEVDYRIMAQSALAVWRGKLPCRRR